MARRHGAGAAVTEDAPILEARDGAALIVTLNRPHALNALTQTMMNRLLATLERAAADPDVRAVVLIGAGRAFCAGGDRKRSQEPDPDGPVISDRFERLRRHVRSVELLREMPKPTIAAVRGPAIGAGLALAAACDLRIVSETVRFRTGFAAAGLSGDFGAAHSLTRLIGGAKARELMLLDEEFGAAQALAMGFVTRVVADEALEHEARALAQKLAGGPSVALQGMKEALLAAETDTFAAALDVETEAQIRSSLSEDAAEARAAFAEKRAPRFKGQ